MRSRLPIYLMVTFAGLAALSWELLWQIEASLALGASALGTAITLAATMGGMTIGALLCGRVLARHGTLRPLRVYAGLELVIGLSGLLLLQPGFTLLARLDASLYRVSPTLAPIVHLLGIVALLGPPTIAMGATVPVFGLLARRHGTSIAILYGMNTAGAAVGVLMMAFVIMPLLGVTRTVWLVAGLNVLVAIAAFTLRLASCPSRPPSGAFGSGGPIEPPPGEAEAASEPGAAVEARVPWRVALLVVAATGFATFALEVAWFRAMRSAFQSTAESFAVILASVLIPLAIAARLVPWLRRRLATPAPLLVGSAVAILLATPLLERLDLIQRGYAVRTYVGLWFYYAFLSLAIVGPSILLLGVAVPWLLEEQRDPRRWGRLYGVNAAAAIVGAIVTAWVLLPAFGFARASWAVGVFVGVCAIAAFPGRVRPIGAVAVAFALLIAICFESGLGRLRVQSRPVEHRVIDHEEGPDATVSVIEIPSEENARDLIIDGLHTASERGAAHYMAWMGRLPMLAHPDPQRTLVICFGTGQTANAIRRERPQALDIVDISAAVFRMGQHFPTNEGVLQDERVRPIVMDGRAWLRRTEERYDVVTLEPMPPYFAASNALYSREFYELIAKRLNPGGVVAQWVPLHLLSPFHVCSVVATFVAVFPNSILWLDTPSNTVIVVGRRGEAAAGAWDWPGFAREALGRNMTEQEVRAAARLDPSGVARYVKTGGGRIITDDNQLLAYGAFGAVLKFRDANQPRR